MKRLSLWFVLFASLMASYAYAQDVDSCQNLANGRDRAVCLQAPLAVAHAALEDTLARIRASKMYTSSSAVAAHFEAAEANWSVTVQLTCEPMRDLYAGGDMSYSMPLDCELDMTRDHRRLLEKLYHAPLYN